MMMVMMGIVSIRRQVHHAVVVLLLVAFAVHLQQVGEGATVTGPTRWDHQMPYTFALTRAPENLAAAKEIVATAAAHLREHTCLNFTEVTDPLELASYPQYVTIVDADVTKCTGKHVEGEINLGPCWTLWTSIAHEMMHMVGLGHEHQRFDSPIHLKVNYSNVPSTLHEAYYSNRDDIYGPYDIDSFMHYNDGVSSSPATAHFTSVLQGLSHPRCTLTVGDIGNINFATQDCRQGQLSDAEVTCQSTFPAQHVIGYAADPDGVLDVSFIGLYLDESLIPSMSGLPSTATHTMSKNDRVVRIRTGVDESMAGQVFNISITFQTVDGQKQATCASQVTVAAAPYVCNGLLSVDPHVCSGRGSCVSHTFPQCECNPGFGGPWCEGLSTCPQRIAFDFEYASLSPWTDANCTYRSYPTDRLHTEVSGVGGRGSAANCTAMTGASTCNLNFMTQYVRQPKEVSFWAIFAPETPGYYLLAYTSHVKLYVSARTIANGDVHFTEHLGDSWSHIRFVHDWSAGTYEAYVNGAFAINGSFYSGCQGGDCTDTKFTVYPSGTGWVAVDEYRMPCDPGHVVASMGGGGAIDSNVLAARANALWVDTSHPEVQWDVERFASEGHNCSTGIGSSLLDGVSFSTSNNATRLVILLPQQRAVQPSLVSQYVLCYFNRRHFKADSQFLVTHTQSAFFQFPGICTQNQTKSWDFVDNGNYLTSLVFPSPVVSEEAVISMGINTTNYFSRPKMFFGFSPSLLTVQYWMLDDRICFDAVCITDDVLRSYESLTVRARFNWTSLTADVYINDIPTVYYTVPVLGGTSLNRLAMVYYNESSFTPCYVAALCPPSALPEPASVIPRASDLEAEGYEQLTPSHYVAPSSPPTSTSPTSTTTTATTEAPPSTTTTTTTEAPPSTTTTTTEAQPSTTTPTTTEAPSSQAPATTAAPNSNAASSFPGRSGSAGPSTAGGSQPATTATTSAPATTTAAPPTTPVVLVSATVRLNGTEFASIVSVPAAKTALITALRADIARLLQVLVEMVVVRSLRLGSLIVDYDVVALSTGMSVDVDAINATLVQAIATQQSDWLATTQAVYVAETGSLETLAVIGSSFVVPTPTEAPQQTTSPLVGLQCTSTVCMSVVVAGLIVATVSITAVLLAVYKRRKN